MTDFEQSRLAVALRLRGMTRRELAAECGVSPQYLTNIEKGRQSPAADLVARFAEALKMPVEYFYKDPIEAFQTSDVSFRSRRGTPARVRDTGLAVSEIVAGIIGKDLEKRFHLPAVNVPDLSKSATPEIAADVLRNFWGLGNGPIQNMVHLLESKGVLVFWLRHDNPALDAISFWHEDRPYVILNSLKVAGDRARFDAAHELAHLVLHRTGSMEGSDPEREANKLSSAFLLPAPRFTNACPPNLNLAALYHLKLEWKVSVAAMIMRASSLGVYSEWETRVAFQKLNSQGELRNERANFPRETSKLHSMVFDGLAKKEISPYEYAAQLSLNLSDLLEFMPVAREFMPELAMKPERAHGQMRVIPGGKKRAS